VGLARPSRGLYLMLNMLGHERLRAWELCHQLTLRVYRASEKWPIQERYGLTSQVRRTAASAPTNLAEGAAKHGSREFRRYVDIALGSIAETSYLLTLAKDLGILTSEEWQSLEELREQAGGLTWRLARSLEHGSR
jgi:four helix bundle protein